MIDVDDTVDDDDRIGTNMRRSGLLIFEVRQPTKIHRFQDRPFLVIADFAYHTKSNALFLRRGVIIVRCTSPALITGLHR